MKQTTLKKTLDNMFDDAFLTLSDAIETLKANAADLKLRDNTRERLSSDLDFCDDAIKEARKVLDSDDNYRSILHRVADALNARDLNADADVEDQMCPHVRFARATSELAIASRRVITFITSDMNDTWTIDALNDQGDDVIDQIDTYIVRTCNDEHVIADAIMKATDTLLKRVAQQRPSDDDNSASAVAFRAQEREQDEQGSSDAAQTLSNAIDHLHASSDDIHNDVRTLDACALLDSKINALDDDDAKATSADLALHLFDLCNAVDTATQTRAQQLADAFVAVARADHYMIGIVERYSDTELDDAEALLIDRSNAVNNADDVLERALDLIEASRRAEQQREAREQQQRDDIARRVCAVNHSTKCICARVVEILTTHDDDER